MYAGSFTAVRLFTGRSTTDPSAYSLRAAFPAHGAARDAMDYTAQVLTIEINSPQITPSFCRRRADYFAGNFHGQPSRLPSTFSALPWPNWQTFLSGVSNGWLILP